MRGIKNGALGAATPEYSGSKDRENIIAENAEEVNDAPQGTATSSGAARHLPLEWKALEGDGWTYLTFDSETRTGTIAGTMEGLLAGMNILVTQIAKRFDQEPLQLIRYMFRAQAAYDATPWEDSVTQIVTMLLGVAKQHDMHLGRLTAALVMTLTDMMENEEYEQGTTIPS